MKTFRAFALLCLLSVSSAFGQQAEDRFTAMNPEQRRAFGIQVMEKVAKDGCRMHSLIFGMVASFKEGHITAWIDPTKTNRDALIAALKKKEVDVVGAAAEQSKTKN